VKHWIPFTDTAIKTRLRKQLEAGCGPRFNAWKKNGQRLDKLTASSRPLAAEH
jgi:hypothetical protein